MSLGNKISEVDRRYFPWYPATASEARQDDGYYLKWCWEMRLRKLPVLIFLTVHRCYFRFTSASSLKSNHQNKSIMTEWRVPMVRPMNLPAPAGRTTFTLTQKIRLAEYASELKQQWLREKNAGPRIWDGRRRKMVSREPKWGYLRRTVDEKLSFSKGCQKRGTVIKFRMQFQFMNLQSKS